MISFSGISSYFYCRTSK